MRKTSILEPGAQASRTIGSDYDDNKQTSRSTSLDQRPWKRSDLWQLTPRVTTFFSKADEEQKAAESKLAIEITKEVAAQKVTDSHNDARNAEAKKTEFCTITGEDTNKPQKHGI